jgi:hypothetical protein
MFIVSTHRSVSPVRDMLTRLADSWNALADCSSFNAIRWQADVSLIAYGPAYANDTSFLTALLLPRDFSHPARFAGLASSVLLLAPHRADWQTGLARWLAAGSGRGMLHTLSLLAARRRLAFHHEHLRCNQHAAFAYCPLVLPPL